jgi:hypothetical protein
MDRSEVNDMYGRRRISFPTHEVLGLLLAGYVAHLDAASDFASPQSLAPNTLPIRNHKAVFKLSFIQFCFDQELAVANPEGHPRLGPKLICDVHGQKNGRRFLLQLKSAPYGHCRNEDINHARKRRITVYGDSSRAPV